MKPQQFNWQQFEHAVLLSAPKEEVLDCVMTARGLSRWFIGENYFVAPDGNRRHPEVCAQKGDRFRWAWLAKDHAFEGEVLAVDENSIRVTFGSIFEVEFTVSTEGDRTRLHLFQEYSKGSDENQFAHLNCCVCWVFFFTNIKSVLEYGNDLRETAVDDEVLVNR